MSEIIIPEYQQMLTMNDWKGTFETDKKERAKKWDLTSNSGADVGQVLRTITNQLPERKKAVIEAGVENIEVFDQRYAPHLTWGERSAMDKSLAENQQNPSDQYRWGFGGYMANVTQDQMESYRIHKQLADLGSDYNSRLTAAGLDTVQRGESLDSVTARLEQGENWEKTESQRKARVEGEKTNILNEVNANRKANNSQRNTLIDRQEQQNRTDEKNEDDRGERREIREDNNEREDKRLQWERARYTLESKAEEKRYQTELTKWREQNRQNSLAALAGGLATLGLGFAL